MLTTLRAEALIERLVGVSAARVEWTAEDTVSRVHVLSDGERPPRTLVRDIQSLLEHQCGQPVHVDAINVVEFGRRSEEAPGRPRLLGFEWTWARSAIRVSCRLGVEDRSAEGSSEREDLHLAAGEAVVQAINSLTGGVLDLRLVAVHTVPTSRGPVILSLVETGGRELLSGSAAKAQRETVEAVIRATLDAVNRQLMRRGRPG